MKRFIGIAMLLAMALLLNACAPGGSDQVAGTNYTYGQAKEEIGVLAERVKPVILPVKLDPNEMFDLDVSYETQSLPDISAYPFAVNPVTSTYLTVYSDNPRIIQAATDFNNAKVVVDDQQVSVCVRPVDSALGMNFILADKYTPDLFIPKSELHGSILSYRGKLVKMVAGTTVRDVSGVVVSSKMEVQSFSELIQKVQNGELSVGYMDPLQDSDALNFILSALHEFDNAQPVGEAAVEGLRKLQTNVTLTAYEKTQLESSYLKGMIDGYVLNYQTYKNTQEYASGHTFIPFGVPQDNPIYAIGELTPIKIRVAEQFAEYCKTVGANVDSIVSSYTSNIAVTPAIAGQLNSTYKSIRGGAASSVTAVFVADVSGSMLGRPMLKLKTGLRAAINVIDPINNVGLVTYSTGVNIAVPIAPFDGKQQSHFSNAITNMIADGRTAMYDAVAVGLDMLIKYQEENQDTKLILFVLTDGNSNVGLDFGNIRSHVTALRIPVYTIGYESESEGLDTEILEQLSVINEASFVDAEADNIVHILTNLLSSQI